MSLSAESANYSTVFSKSWFIRQTKKRFTIPCEFWLVVKRQVREVEGMRVIFHSHGHLAVAVLMHVFFFWPFSNSHGWMQLQCSLQRIRNMWFLPAPPYASRVHDSLICLRTKINQRLLQIMHLIIKSQVLHLPYNNYI